jgi:hypothetical protein
MKCINSLFVFDKKIPRSMLMGYLTQCEYKIIPISLAKNQMIGFK